MREHKAMGERECFPLNATSFAHSCELPRNSRFLFTPVVESPISLFHFVLPSFSAAFLLSRYLPPVRAGIAGVTNELADFQ